MEPESQPIARSTSEPVSGRDVRTSFAIASRFYKWRVPYPANLFESACRLLKLDRDSAVLDVCCGSGDLAVGFANHVGRVAGLDFSERMLALAPRHERVDYIRHDINTLPVPEILQQVRFDCFAIGRAIHWIDEGALAQVTEQNLKREGCILICGSGFSDKTK